MAILHIIHVQIFYTDNSSELCTIKILTMGKEIIKSGETTACRQVYAELLCDFMFKRLFGTIANKDILIWFLNILMDDKEIVDVSFIPTEHLGMTEEDRKAIFDISVECKNGETFIIEMQKVYQKHFRERAVYYNNDRIKLRLKGKSTVQYRALFQSKSTS